MLRACEDRLGVEHGYFTSVVLLGVQELDRRELWPAESDTFHARRGKSPLDTRAHILMAQSVSVEFARRRENRMLAAKGPKAAEINQAREVWAILHLTVDEYRVVKNPWSKLSKLMKSLGIEVGPDQLRLAEPWSGK